jgi:pseudomonalisin
MFRPLRYLSLALVAFTLLTISAQAQRVINDADRMKLQGNTHSQARAEFDRGPADISTPMKNMVLSLSVRPGAQADLQNLLAQQQDPNSPNFHKFLTPEQFGARFGATDQDLADVTNWLTAQGFKIEEVGKGRLWVNFSGNVQQVERAFQTNIRKYEVDGQMHQANASDPSLPRGFAGLVSGVVTLHNFPRHHFLSKVTKLSGKNFSTRAQLPTDFKVLKPAQGGSTTPDFTSGANHFLAPADFATIYNVNALYSAGITGTGQSIAIVGRTDIKLADVQFFRSFFALPAHDPVFVHNGADPGDLGGGEETEADLDVEWSGGIGQGATVNFVISASTATTDGVDLSAQFIVNNNTAPIMSTSFGQCEANMGTAENNFYNNLWSQAAAEGISAFVSSGDSGAAGCDASNAATGTVRAVSGLSSPPNVTAVGGTEFNEGTGTFWNTTNNATNQSSAISYIPEKVWNESGSVTGGSGLGATGGGASTIYAKPAFQTGTGVPADGHRDVPDVALSAAGHDGYVIVQGHTTGTTGLAAVGGTSAASPSFAGLMTLVLQKTGARQGNANTAFYNMGRNQQAGGTAVYHDCTTGNNTVPGVTGFNATVGFDLATGWGSVNAANLVNFWNNNGGTATPDFSLAASPASLSIAQGSAGSSTISVTDLGGFTGAVTLSASGLPAGVTASFGTNPATSTSVLTLTASTTATTGAATVTITGTSGTLTHTTSVSLTVTAVAAPNFSLSASPASVAVTQGSTGTSTITVTKTGGFTGSATLSASGLPAGVTASFGTNPASTTSVVTFTASATATVGTATVTITGVSGTLSHTTTISLTVNSSVVASNLIVNGGFETGTTTAPPWTLTAGVLNTSASEPPHAGTKDAWMDGYGTTHTDTVTQSVTIPAAATTATLTFFLHIDTAETTTTTAFDTLTVQVLNSAGTVLQTLGTFSNLNKAAGYTQRSLPITITSIKGQTVQIKFTGKEDASLQTSFVIDDVALNVQ